jgi:hypothetical protein
VTAFCQTISSDGADAGGSAGYKELCPLGFSSRFPYMEPSGHSQPFESMGFSQPRSASVSANADGSADDEQAGIAQD